MPIFDQGYQHWNGHLASHAWRWLAITRHGVRTALKNRAIRMLLFVAWAPALALAALLCLWGLLERNSDLIAPIRQFLSFLGEKPIQAPLHYRVEIWTLCYDLFFTIQLRFSMFLILLIGPQLISQDLRFNALPLYFSRPLRRIDYFIGKLGIITAFLAMVVIVPSIVAYILGLLFSLDISILRDTFRILLAAVVYGLIISISAGLLILALSSLSRNSRYIALIWVGIWFVSSVAAGILESASRQQRIHEFYAAAAQSEGTPMMRVRQRRSFVQRHQDQYLAFQEAEYQTAKTDWRPMLSYTTNLSRIGRRILNSDAAWQTFADLQPPFQRTQFLLNTAGPPYPWYWSALVLTGIFGLSAWILNSKIRSLDRLK